VRAVDLGTVVDVENVDGMGIFLDPVGAAQGSVTVGQGAEQRFTDALRVDRKSGLAEFQHGRGDRLGKPLRDSPPRGRLEPDLVAAGASDGQVIDRYGLHWLIGFEATSD
jgi:hypothetical protein